MNNDSERPKTPLRRRIGRSFPRLARTYRALHAWAARQRARILVSRDLVAFCRWNDGRFVAARRDWDWKLSDKVSDTPFDAHYVYHPAWATRVLALTKPRLHVDISSTLYFSTQLSAFIPVRFYDYRPARLKLSNLESHRADLTDLSFPTGSVDSLSCMHTIEHVGLGRYGDPVNPRADLKAMSELKRVLAPQGNLLVVVPVGKPRLLFNAHRVYSYAMIMDSFADLRLKGFTLVPDDGVIRGMIEDATEQDADAQEYGCGCFWFQRG